MHLSRIQVDLNYHVKWVFAIRSVNGEHTLCKFTGNSALQAIFGIISVKDVMG
jgi:hypothetical protein